MFSAVFRRFGAPRRRPRTRRAFQDVTPFNNETAPRNAGQRIFATREARAFGVRLALTFVMRITVSGLDAPLADAKRAYAEYRFFTAIAPFDARVRAVDVAIRRDPANTPQFLCIVFVDLADAGALKTLARAAHPTAAIDRAADRAAWLVGRRLGRDVTLKTRAFSS
jgi:ribosome-associated translation inhibitor RaiA